MHGAVHSGAGLAWASTVVVGMWARVQCAACHAHASLAITPSEPTLHGTEAHLPYCALVVFEAMLLSLLGHHALPSREAPLCLLGVALLSYGMLWAFLGDVMGAET